MAESKPCPPAICSIQILLIFLRRLLHRHQTLKFYLFSPALSISGFTKSHILEYDLMVGEGDPLPLALYNTLICYASGVRQMCCENPDNWVLAS